MVASSMPKICSVLLTVVMTATVFAIFPAPARAATAYSEHSVIRINGDAELIVGQNGIVSGTGTSSDPYIISGWQIGPSSGSGGIEIWGTRSHVKIDGVYIYSCSIGISLDNVTDVSVVDSVLYKNIVGVSVLYSKNCRISGSTFRENYYAVSITYSEVKRSGNTYVDNTKNLIEKKQPWEQGWLGTLVCFAILAPLLAIASILLYYRVKFRPKPPKTPEQM